MQMSSVCSTMIINIMRFFMSTVVSWTRGLSMAIGQIMTASSWKKEEKRNCMIWWLASLNGNPHMYCAWITRRGLNGIVSRDQNEMKGNKLYRSLHNFGLAEAIVIREKVFIKIEFSAAFFSGAIAEMAIAIGDLRQFLFHSDQFNIWVSLSIGELFISLPLKSETEFIHHIAIWTHEATQLSDKHSWCRLTACLLVAAV